MYIHVHTICNVHAVYTICTVHTCTYMYFTHTYTQCNSCMSLSCVSFVPIHLYYVPILCIIDICIVIPGVISCINACNSALGTRLLCGPLKALSRAAAPVGSVARVTT